MLRIPDALAPAARAPELVGGSPEHARLRAAGHTVGRDFRYPEDAGEPVREDPYLDMLIIVDGAVIGGTYYCGADYIRDGERYASWGRGGLSMRHATRGAAEAVQLAALGLGPAGPGTETPETGTEIGTAFDYMVEQAHDGLPGTGTVWETIETGKTPPFRIETQAGVDLLVDAIANNRRDPGGRRRVSVWSRPSKLWSLAETRLPRQPGRKGLS